MGSGKIKIWLKGSILEPLVAIVIMVTTIGMAFSVLAKVNIVPQVMAINKAAELINSEVFLVYSQKDYLDKEIHDGAFTLTKQVSRAGKTNAVIIVLTVQDASNKVIASRTFQVFDTEIVKVEKTTDEE
jgi:hypothetical protein